MGDSYLGLGAFWSSMIGNGSKLSIFGSKLESFVLYRLRHNHKRKAGKVVVCQLSSSSSSVLLGFWGARAPAGSSSFPFMVRMFLVSFSFHDLVSQSLESSDFPGLNKFSIICEFCLTRIPLPALSKACHRRPRVLARTTV